MTTKIYSYGAKPPVQIDEVRKHLRGANDYRNALVEIEQKRRDAANAVLLRMRPEIASLTETLNAAQKAIDDAVVAMGQSRAKERSMKAGADGKDALRDARHARSVISRKLKIARKDAFASPDVQAELQEVEKAANVAKKHAYSQAQCHWGTRLQINEAAKAFRKGMPPKFHRFVGEGKVSVQVQGGISPAELSDDTRVAVSGQGKIAVAKLRIGSNPDRSPIWAEVPVNLHRELPADSRIKWAWLLCRKVASHEVWRVQFTVTGGEEVFAKESASSGEVGIDVGWRLTDAGLRVAYWFGSDGVEGQLIIPHEHMSLFRRPDEIQSTRDRHFNGALAALVSWRDGEAAPEWISFHANYLRGRIAVDKSPKNVDRIAMELAAYELAANSWPAKKHALIPEWLAEKIKNAGQWRGASRLAAIMIEWRGKRFDGDCMIFDLLEAWRKRDKHLWEFSENLRDQNQAWRKDTYSVFAAMLRRRYATAKIEDTDWSKMQRSPHAEDAKSEDDAIRKNMRIASIGMLLETIRREMACVDVPAAETTQRCSDCGALTGESKVANLYHACAACGATRDQDQNAARNLLNYGASVPVVAGESGIARRRCGGLV